jgi:hypothetical protein
MRIALVASLILVSSAVSYPSYAAGKGASPESSVKAAKKACLMGDYKKGTEILSDLYIETSDLNLLYNLARCFEQNHRWEEALDRFLEYQRKTPDTTASGKADVEKHIGECKDHMKEAATVAPPPAPVVPTAPVPAAEARPPATVLESVQETAPSPVHQSQDGSALRWAGTATGVVGLASLGVGIYCSVKSYDVRDDPSKLDNYKTIGYVAYGVGAAALATGLSLYLIGHGRSENSHAVAILPAPVPGGSVVSLAGVF